MAGRRARPSSRTPLALVTLAGSVVVALVAIAVVLVRPGPADPDPASSSSARASSPAGWQSFTSPRYGYEVNIPADWRVSVVPGSGGLHPGEPGIDSFFGSNRQLGIAAIPVATTPDSWVSPITVHYEGAAADGHALEAASTEAIALDGRSARLSTYHFEIPPYVTMVLEAEVVADDRGYMLTFLGLGQQDLADRELFLQVLGSFRLTGG